MACVGRFPGKKRQNDNVKRGANPDRGSISGYAEIHQAGIFYDKALQPTAQEEFPRAPFLDNFRVAYNPGVDRLGQHCRVFILQWIDLERLVVPRTGRKSRYFPKR